MTEKELLAVLDLPEDEQCKQLASLFQDLYFKTDEWPEWYGVCDILVHDTSLGRTVILRSLAFHFRDEAVAIYEQGWCSAKSAVMHHLTGGYSDYGWDIDSKPIWWIIAAIKAKQEKVQ